MFRKILSVSVLTILFFQHRPLPAQNKPDSSGYIDANGVYYWYEIHGKGEPLLLLHGGLMSTQDFASTLTKLAENCRVIGVDLLGHGHTALGTRKINLVDIGHDLGVVVQKLGLKQVDVMREFMRQSYDWSANVKRLTMPVMLVYGDADMIRPEHIVSFYKLLGGGLKDAGWMREHMSKNRLAIIPDLTHYEIGTAPILAISVLPFLNGQSNAKTGTRPSKK